MRFLPLFALIALLALPASVEADPPIVTGPVFIDVEDDSSPANDDLIVGSVETCKRIDVNGVLDADEDVIDSLEVDVVVDLPGIPMSNRLVEVDLTLNHTPGIVQVDGHDFDFMLGHNAVSSLVGHGEYAAPGEYYVQGADLNFSSLATEYGPGTLMRFAVRGLSTTPRIVPLTLTGVILYGPGPTEMEPSSIGGAAIALNADTCADLDSDGDSAPDWLDNCPTPNIDQANTDGDPWGDGCESAPCQNFATNWNTPAGDDDCDGYGDTTQIGIRAAETFVGTDPNDGCADTLAPNDERGPAFGEPLSPWVMDTNDNGLVTSNDLLSIGIHFGKISPDPDYSPRYDFNGDGRDMLNDLLQAGPFIGRRCTP